MMEDEEEAVSSYWMMDDLKTKRGYCKLKKEALDHTRW